MRGRSIAQVIVSYLVYVDMGAKVPADTVRWTPILGPGYRPDRIGD